MKRFLLGLCAFLMVGLSGAVDAFDEIQLQVLQLLGENCPSCDLSRAKLNKEDLSGRNLTAADLTQAYLEGANLSGADLSDAKLNGCPFGHARLEPGESDLGRP